MPNTDWTKLEGTHFRIDVGTPKSDALAATDNDALLHIATTSVDGLMSKEDKALLEELKTKVATLVDNNTYK